MSPNYTLLYIILNNLSTPPPRDRQAQPKSGDPGRLPMDNQQGKVRGFMSFLDFENNKDDLKFIKSALRRRGFFMNEEGEW